MQTLVLGKHSISEGVNVGDWNVAVDFVCTLTLDHLTADQVLFFRSVLTAPDQDAANEIVQKQPDDPSICVNIVREALRVCTDWQCVDARRRVIDRLFELVQLLDVHGSDRLDAALFCGEAEFAANVYLNDVFKYWRLLADPLQSPLVKWSTPRDMRLCHILEWGRNVVESMIRREGIMATATREGELVVLRWASSADRLAISFPQPNSCDHVRAQWTSSCLGGLGIHCLLNLKDCLRFEPRQSHSGEFFSVQS
jgi:hypothetical protein